MPAGSEARPPVTPPTLPHTFRPLGVRMAITVLGGMLLLICAVTWLAFPAHIRAEFSLPEKLTLIAIGLGLFAAGYALARSRLVARTSGIVVVNGYKRHRYHWNEVLAVSLRRGNPWAILDLSDGTSMPAMGIQSSDGGRAVTQVRQLRALVAQMTRPED